MQCCCPLVESEHYSWRLADNAKCWSNDDIALAVSGDRLERLPKSANSWFEQSLLCSRRGWCQVPRPSLLSFFSSLVTQRSSVDQVKQILSRDISGESIIRICQEHLTQTMAPIVRTVADGGIQIAYTEPLSRHPPGLHHRRGIGLKKASKETWEDLYDVKLFQLEWTIQAPGLTSGSVFLPRMGMPPREPDEDIMKLARAGESFANTGWFIYASVMRAIDALPRDWIKLTPSPPGYPVGDDVVISLPDVASGLQYSMKEVDAQGNPKVHPAAGKEIQKSFEFRTALPEAGTGIPGEIYDLDHLYFIQLLPNELPSYHFWATAKDTPTARKGHRDRRIYTWFSTNANTSNPDSNRKQGLRDTTSSGTNRSSSINGPRTCGALGLSTGRHVSTKGASPTKARPDPKASKKTSSRKKNVDRSYKPRKGEEEVPEVKLNKRRKKVAEDAKSYRPQRDDDEESLQVKPKKRKRKVSEDSKPYRPERIGSNMD